MTPPISANFAIEVTEEHACQLYLHIPYSLAAFQNDNMFVDTRRPFSFSTLVIMRIESLVMPAIISTPRFQTNVLLTCLFVPEFIKHHIRITHVNPNLPGSLSLRCFGRSYAFTSQLFHDTPPISDRTTHLERDNITKLARSLVSILLAKYTLTQTPQALIYV